MPKHNSIVWPAILIIENDDLLYYLSSEESLVSELENYYLTPDDSCTILMQSGQQYSLNYEDSEHLKLHSLTKLDLKVFNQLVRNHLSARQQCCVLKINISTYEQGFNLVKNTGND